MTSRVHCGKNQHGGAREENKSEIVDNERINKILKRIVRKIKKNAAEISEKKYCKNLEDRESAIKNAETERMLHLFKKTLIAN